MKRRDSSKNQGLIPVPKTSGESMGILYVEKDGIFGLKNNRWIKVYRLDSPIFGEAGREILTNLKTRVRQTYLGIDKKYYLYLSVMAYGESLMEAKEIIEEEAKNIGRITGFNPLDISKTMQAMQEFFVPLGLKNKDFNFASAIRKNKKGWQELCSVKGEEKDFYIRYPGGYVLNYFVMDFGDSFNRDLYNYILSMNSQFLISLDFEPLLGDILHSLNKTLEKRYNRRLADMGEKIFNLSHTYSLVFKSMDAALIYDKEFKRRVKDMDFTLSQAYSFQETLLLSAASFGITDFNKRRNVLQDTLHSFLI